MTDSATFRTVMRGYDPAEVDRSVGQLRQAAEQSRMEAADRAVEVTKLRSAVSQLESELTVQKQQLVAAETERKHTAPPSFAELGERIGQILSLAQAEADEVRTTAQTAANKLATESTTAADAARAAADRYAQDTSSRADAEATRIVAAAKRESDDILDHADREATARREEAEAVYEHQRARAAQAAADFEKTLADRRDKAAADFAAQMSAHEAAVARAEEQLAAIGVEAERTRSDADAQAQALLSGAREEATGLVEQAKAAAERIRRESDRELQAATSRRDAITAQLTNVRQMLATLGGSSLADVLAEPSPAPAAPAAAAEPAVEATTVDLAKAESTAVEDEDEDGKPEA